MGTVHGMEETPEVLLDTQPSLADPFVSSPPGFGFDPAINGNARLHVAGEFALEKENGNLADEVLEGLEEYWDDINDRLIVSRMVSDSVVKGIVTAVEQDAAEKIASKDLQLANLKEYLHSKPQEAEVGAGRVEGFYFPVVKDAVFEVGDCGNFSCVSNACMEHDKLRDQVGALRTSSREQFERAKKEIEFARASTPIKRIGSASELVGLVGILHEKHVDKMLQHLKITVDDVCTQVDDLLLSSKISLCELQQEQELTRKLEGMVLGSVLRTLQEEFEDNLWDQNAQYFASQNMDWIEKFNLVAGLRTQLDAILESLSVHDTGLVSHGSLDFDHPQHKVLSNHETPPAPHFGENGNIHVVESYDFQQLKHMSNVELVAYFNNIITKMKRDHESALQQKTEEYFRLKRESLKERAFLTHRKDEEFDVLRKKIPEVILKLEDFNLENERFPLLARNVDNIVKLKHRLDSLQSENCHLRDCLANEKNDVKCPEDKVSSAAAKSFENSLSEERTLKGTEIFNSERADSCIETSLNQEVYKCSLREQIAQTSCNSEDSQMELLMTLEIYDIILKEAAFPIETAYTFDFEDSDIESLIMQGLSGIILLETVKDAGQEFVKLYQEVQINKSFINCLETRSLEKENELNLEVKENWKLKQEILHLEREIQEKEKLAMELSISLSKEREQFKQASIELCRELELLRVQHLEALGHIKIGKIEMQKLDQMLDQTKHVLLETKKERNTALSLVQEMNEKLLSNGATEEKLKVEMKKVVNELSKMFDDFQCRVSNAIGKNSLRLAAVLRKTGLVYRRKLERRSADLQMAEAEVDLLGDEVDALLSLLEKTYTALDHYSPILKHYPGITEILELVRRELSSESTNMP